MADTDVTPNRGTPPDTAPGTPPAGAAQATVGAPSAADAPADVTRELTGVPAGEQDVSTLRQERARLEAENNALRHKLERPGRTKRIVRSVSVWILLVLAWIITPLSVVTVWAHNVMFDQSTYMATVDPLASNPQVQKTVADYIVFQIESKVDIQSAARDVLPPRADFLAPPIANAVNGFISTAVNKFVTGDRFKNLWHVINLAAFTSVYNFLTDKPGAVQVNNGKIVLDLAPVFTAVENNLSSSGIGGLISQLPLDRVNTQFPIADAGSLEKVRDQINLFATIAIVLPFVALAALAGAVVVSPRHRHTLAVGAFGIAATMLLLAIALALARSAYLDAVTGPHLPRDTAAVIFDTIVQILRDGLRLVFAVALIIGIGAFLWGPSRAAVWVRRTVARGVTWVRTFGEHRGVTTGPVGLWVGANKTWLRVAAVALGGLIFILWNQPTPITVLVIAIVVAVLLVLIELIGRAPSKPAVPVV